MTDPVPPPGIDEKAALFALRHGSFALCFDATMNPASLDFAASELDGSRVPDDLLASLRLSAEVLGCDLFVVPVPDLEAQADTIRKKETA